MPDKVIIIKQLNTLYSGALARGAPWEENVVNYPSEKIWQSRDRIPPDRRYHRHTNTKFRAVCAEGLFARKRMGTAFCEA